MKKLKLTKSKSYYQRAKKIIPNLTQCFSKGPSQFSFGTNPIYVKKGKGAYLTDVDDNKYIDYGMGLHPVILGYAHPKITKAVTEAVSAGITLTLMHPLEVEVAATLKKQIPSAEMVRFAKTGSEATSAAIRIARAYTKREKVICCGYHGWHDWFICLTERNEGIPKAVKNLSYKFPYNDIESLNKLFKKNKGQVAAVIMEPCGVVPPDPGFLKECKKLTQKNGALFIFDEIITGIRWHRGGAQKMFGVTPDLSTFGKCLANGMPLTAVVGKSKYMKILDRHELFFSSTYAGEFVSLAAAQVTQEIIKKERVIPFIWKQGRYFMKNFNSLMKDMELGEFLQMVGYPCRPVISMNGKDLFTPLEIKSLIQQETAKRGLLFTGYFAMSLAHDKKIIDKTLNIFEKSLSAFKQAIADKNIKKYLKGEVVQPIIKHL